MIGRKLLVLACAISVMPALAKDDNCTVNGLVNGVEKNAKVLVIRHVGEHQTDTISTGIAIADGKFSVDIPASELHEIYELRIVGQRSGVTFVAEPGQVSIQGESGKLWAAEIKGTPENQRYMAYQQFVQSLSKESNAITMSGQNLTKDEKAARYDELKKKQKHFTDSLIQNCPNSIVALYLAKVPLLMMSYKEIDNVLAGFENKFSDHKYYVEMKKRADVLRKVAEGAMAPDFEVVQPDGVTKISLSAFRGKYVLLDFWASWCAPCRIENKHTKELYEKYNPHGLEVISFSLDSDLEAWNKAIQKDSLHWPNASDLVGGVRSPVAQIYGIVGIPAIWLIDPSGRIVGDNVRGEALTKLLDEKILKK